VTRSSAPAPAPALALALAKAPGERFEKPSPLNQQERSEPGDCMGTKDLLAVAKCPESQERKPQKRKKDREGKDRNRLMRDRQKNGMHACPSGKKQNTTNG